MRAFLSIFFYMFLLREILAGSFWGEFAFAVGPAGLFLVTFRHAVHVPSVAKLTDSISNSRLHGVFFLLLRFRLCVFHLFFLALRDVRPSLSLLPQVLGHPHHHNDIQLMRQLHSGLRNALYVSIDSLSFSLSSLSLHFQLAAVRISLLIHRISCSVYIHFFVLVGWPPKCIICKERAAMGNLLFVSRSSQPTRQHSLTLYTCVADADVGTRLLFASSLALCHLIIFAVAKCKSSKSGQKLVCPLSRKEKPITV